MDVSRENSKRIYVRYLGAALVVRLHLHTLTQIHEGLVDLASFCERLARCFSISGTLRSCQVNNSKVTARPGTLTFCVPLLDLDVEEAVTSRADRIAPSASDFALHETSLQHHHSFLEASADDLGEAGDNLSVWALLSALEKQRPAFHIWLLVLCGVPAQQVEDAVVVNFVHGHNDGIFCARVCRYLDVGDRRGLWQR